MRTSVTFAVLRRLRLSSRGADYDAAVTKLPARPRARASTPEPVASAQPGQAVAPSALLLVGVVLMAANMRPLATSVGPLIHQIDSGLRLSGAAAGLLLTIPVLCFGAIAPLGALLQHRLGTARTVALILGTVTAGLLARVSGGVVMLFAGTALAAAGAACGNVLLPVVVRRSFSHRVGRASALYTTALVGSAALASGATVPLAHAIGEGWRGGLAVWAAPAMVALLVWLPQLRGAPGEPASQAAPARRDEPAAQDVPAPPAAPARRDEPAAQDVPAPQAGPAQHDVRQARMREVTRSRITWQLTLFFATQSWGFYATLAWLPSIFENHGIGSTSAGLLLGLSGIMAVPAALLVPSLAARLRDQARLAVALTAVTLLGYGGLLLAPAGAPALWAILIGFGQGACFPLALTLIVLRSGSAQLTAGLSTHVQCIGYLLAAAGPFVIGALHDATGSWTTSLIVLTAILALQALSGAGAGRDRTLGARAVPTSG